MKRIFFLALLAVLFVGCANNGEATIKVYNNTELTFNEYWIVEGGNKIQFKKKINFKPGDTFTDVFSIPTDRKVQFCFLTDKSGEDRVRTESNWFAGDERTLNLTQFSRTHAWAY